MRRSALALVAFLLLAGSACAVEVQESPAKRVLLISTGSRLAPGFILVDQQILQVLRSITSTRIETFAENLDIVRFPAERTHRIFEEYLAAKYSEFPPDLIILVFVGNLGISGTVLEELFPNTPLIVAGYTEEGLRREQFGPLVSGIAQRVDPESTLELMLRLQPDLRRVVVIGGTAEVDQQIVRRVRQIAERYGERVAIEFWDNLSMADLRRAVTLLPPQTAILYTRMFKDAAGQALISSEVGQWLGRTANVPVYVLVDPNLGTGAVGGAIASAEAFGRRAGELARLILTGTAPSSLPFEARSLSVPIVDWRALKRWGISEDRLPPDTEVRFRPLSVWTQYRWYIVGALAILLMQSATIAALALQRQRRRRAQTALQDSQQLIELATDAGELGLWSRDLARNELWANASMRSLFGLDARTPLSFDDIFARIHPDDRVRAVAEVERAHAAGQSFEIEYRTLLPNGRARWLLVKGRSVVARGANPRRMGVVLDITRRKQAEESLNEQRAFLRQVIDINPNFIFAKDRGGRFTLANKAVADAYGVTVDELIGKTDADFNPHRDEVEAFRRIDAEVMETLQERFIAEERITDAAGNVRWLQTVKRPIVGRDGRAHQVLGASTDITQRRKTELELQQERAELAHVARVFLMGELAASLAHELNQPLTAILSNATAGLRFMSREPLDFDEVREILKDIIEADKRAAEVIRHMRALIRKDETHEFAPLDLSALIVDVVALVHSDALMQSVRLCLELEDGLPPVRGDRIQLQQVMLNILLNAFDASRDCPPEDRTITVRAESVNGRTNRVSVSDCGKGLRDEELAKAFEPFYTTKREGLGMGLSISRSIIESHGGTLSARNNPDRGATFYFTLPVEDAARSAGVSDASTSRQD
jgi:PAS domain S-box-containing protein